MESYTSVEHAPCFCGFTNRHRLLPFRENSGPSITKKITPKNDYFSVVQSVHWNWLCINRTLVAWIGRGGTIAWPPRSSDLTPLNFSVWGYVKDKYEYFVPPLPAHLEDLRAPITEAVVIIDADMIHRTWDEIAYRSDICRVTRGNHIVNMWISADKN